MKKWGKQPKLHFDESELKTDLGSDHFIFVGSSCDMWAWDIPAEWILKTLNHCCKFERNRWLFQSKNPNRFTDFYGYYPKINELGDSIIFGTTIETNREKYINKDAPAIVDRYCGIHTVGKEDGCRTMVTIEPIMDFDLKEMVEIISDIEPEWVNIGANTNYSVQLREPDPGKIRKLISALKELTEVKIKKNLKRLVAKREDVYR